MMKISSSTELFCFIAGGAERSSEAVAGLRSGETFGAFTFEAQSHRLWQGTSSHRAAHLITYWVRRGREDRRIARCDDIHRLQGGSIMRNTLKRGWLTPLILSIWFACCMLTGCAAVSSQRVDKNVTAEGLVYHLPLKKVKLSVTIATTTSGTPKRTETPDVAVSDAYPDNRTTFLLNFRQNLIAKNDLKIGISEKGLLSSATAATTSSVNDIVKGVAGSLGAMRANDKRSITPAAADPCPEDGTYTLYVDARDAGPHTLCDTVFTLNLESGGTTDVDEVASLAPPDKQRDGFYYRQLIPVAVYSKTNADANRVAAFIAFVPDPEQISFIAIPHSVFAASTTTLAFTDGMPTKYEPNADSEVLSAVKLPADAIGSYAAALGQIFKAFADARANQTEAAKNEMAARYGQAKATQCAKAIVSNQDDATIKALCGVD